MAVDAGILSQLRVLQRQYLQLVEPSQLRWPSDRVLMASDVQSWMFTNLFDLDRVKSPPPERYQLRVLKLLISKLERSIDDPEEDVRFPVSSQQSALSSRTICLVGSRLGVAGNDNLTFVANQFIVSST